MLMKINDQNFNICVNIWFLFVWELNLYLSQVHQSDQDVNDDEEHEAGF